MEKVRADVLIVQKGLAKSREQAKRMIMAGDAIAGTMRIDKPGELLDADAEIRIKENSIKYVSRGGYKLEKILDTFDIDLQDKIAMDIGSSTGGFTDCMLQHGAKKVYAIDVGYNQLAYSLRIDERVVVMEKTNFRTMDVGIINERIDFISIDVSFISLKHIFPNASKLISDTGYICALIKPQFEAGKEKVGKKGVVRDEKVHEEVIENVLGLAKEEGLYPVKLTYSPIRGQEGNIEFLVLLQKENSEYNFDIKEIVKEAHKLR